MTDTQPNVLMVAAECRDLAKVGGLGDVVRDLSKALRAGGTPARIIMPCYTRISHAPHPISRFKVSFGQRDDWPVRIFLRELDRVPIYLVESPDFFGGPYGEIYIDSDRLGRGPFEDDAQRFAFFSAAVVAFLARHPELGINVLHCHDWHTAPALVLLKYDPRYQELAHNLRTLFTIHNLDYQGVRPFELAGVTEFAAFGQWFPELYATLKDRDALTLIRDEHSPIPCFNPMRASINLADNVNTVSPCYAVEITQPDDPARNFIGGRGLEQDLQRLGDRLHGILNGLDYDLYAPNRLTPPFDVDTIDWTTARHAHKAALLDNLVHDLTTLAHKSGAAFKNADRVLDKLATFDAADWKGRMLVVAVTRAVRQKMSILLEPLDERPASPEGTTLQQDTVIDALLTRQIALILLGTGELEKELEAINAAPNGLFVAAFDPALANRLYAAGDLFLMPSDFEPCGISQMIAMREGCLPLVPDLGGLSNTVRDRETGFVYSGDSRPAACQALLDTLDRAVQTFTEDQSHWTAMQEQAMRMRFDWTTAAEQYIELYK
ncbi:MAG: glycogen/starch synthase [Anaerolineae bacterium]